MSEIYIPGVNSRFDTDKIIEGLMKVERIPKERAEKTVEDLKTQKSYWQEVGVRMSSLRETARQLYSFQNPFTERSVLSSNESILSATATREASLQERSFTVQQAAGADRFLSTPLPEKYQVPEGSYVFTVGEEEIEFTFRGGTLRDFTDSLNRRSRNVLKAELITVEPGTQSLIIEALRTGASKRLGFSQAAETLALDTGIIEKIHDGSINIDVSYGLRSAPSGPVDTAKVRMVEDALSVAAEGASRIQVSPSVPSNPALVLELESAVIRLPYEQPEQQGPPPGPQLPEAGGASYGGIDIENDPSSVPLPPWNPPPAPKRVDNMEVIYLTFADGTSTPLPPLVDSTEFSTKQYRLEEYTAGKEISAIDIINRNTHRDIALRNIRIYDPESFGGFKARNPITKAQDAILSMDGIEVRREENAVSDLIPGVTVHIQRASDDPIRMTIEPNKEAVKDALIGMVGNYNRLMAEINVLTRNDNKIVEELTYLSKDEKAEMQTKLGALQGDSTLNQFRSKLQMTAASAFPTTAGQELTLLSQLGISTDARRISGGYDVSRLRGYLEIDEKVLDTALSAQIPAIRELFGSDTDADLIIDSGFAYEVDTMIRPYVESGGIISMRTGGIDTRISQEEKRIEALDRQLATKEDSLKRQYGEMEGALDRMERSSTSIEQFSNRSNNN